jgi:hypothetical protein
MEELYHRTHPDPIPENRGQQHEWNTRFRVGAGAAASAYEPNLTSVASAVDSLVDDESPDGYDAPNDALASSNDGAGDVSSELA